MVLRNYVSEDIEVTSVANGLLNGISSKTPPGDQLISVLEKPSLVVSEAYENNLMTIMFCDCSHGLHHPLVNNRCVANHRNYVFPVVDFL